MSSSLPLPLQPIDRLQVFRHRRPLLKTSQALAEGQLTIGFLGGSITEDGDTNWPGPLSRWFAQTFPYAKIISENAGMGATGSDSGCLRVQREIIDTGCQLTFVEYAVNDSGFPTERRMRSREGLIRKLLSAGHEVVLVYTFQQEMYAHMIEGNVPPSIEEFEKLAEHYGLGSVWVGLHAFNEVRQGGMKWGEWLPDCLHPAHRGSWSYAQAVIQFLSRELLQSKTSQSSNHAASIPLPEPLNPRHWQSARTLPFSSVTQIGPWVLRRVQNSLHTGQVLETHTPEAKLIFEFEGTGLLLISEYGKRSAEFSYCIDGGEQITVERQRYDWGGNCGMVQPWVITDDLLPGKHHVELEVIHGNRAECTGTEFRLAQIGVL